MRTPAPRGAFHRRPRRPAALAASVMLAAVLTPSAALAQAPTWDPQITVTPSSDLDPEGATVTVSGSGFDPAASPGTRPPLMGQPAGFYVVYGDFDAHWRPSEGAPTSSRRADQQRWVLPAASRSQLDPTSSSDQYVTLAADGTFSFTLDLEPLADPSGEVGVHTYAGSGAVNPDHELAVPITFATPGAGDTDGEDTDGSDTDSGDDSDGDGDGDEGGDADDGGDVDGPRVISDGHVRWGVKASFRSYVAGPIASGSTTTSDGATTTEDGTFRFGSATGSYDPHTGQVEATATGTGLLDVATVGTVRFRGHESDGEHLLDVTLSDPAVTIDGDVGMLSLDARSRGLDDPDTAYDEVAVPFADLDLAGIEPAVSGDVLTFSEVPATLTEEGARAFAGFYEAGDDLDPVTLVLALDGATIDDDLAGGDEQTDDGAEEYDDAPSAAGVGGGDPTAPAGEQLPVTGTSVPVALALGLLLLALGTSAVRRTTEA